MTRAHDRRGTADEIEQQAAGWLARVDHEGTPDTSRALAAWLGANPRHRAAFLRISEAWRRADNLRRLAEPGEEADPDLLAPERPPAGESITEPASATEPESSVRVSAARPGRRESRRTLRMALAAALAVLAIGATAWLARSFDVAPTYSTAIGEFRRMTLADGSSVALNTATIVHISYTASQRRVELLQGEAQFEVAHDTRRPFLVSAGNTVVRAVGTAFSVRLRSPESVDVLVSEGRVAIDPPSLMFVSAGEIASVRQQTITTRAVDDMTRRLAWMEGMIIFNGETLSEAVAEFNRYNRRQLVITDAAIAGKRIGGAFRATSPDGFAAALTRAFPIEARIHERTGGTEIRLSSGAP